MKHSPDARFPFFDFSLQNMCAFAWEKLIHFIDRPYEALNGTVRPASVFLKEDCGLEFVVAEISYGEFIRKFIKSDFFSLVSTC